jgi:hypothetical protein
MPHGIHDNKAAQILKAPRPTKTIIKLHHVHILFMALITCEGPSEHGTKPLACFVPHFRTTYPVCGVHVGIQENLYAQSQTNSIYLLLWYSQYIYPTVLGHNMLVALFNSFCHNGLRESRSIDI